MSRRPAGELPGLEQIAGRGRDRPEATRNGDRLGPLTGRSGRVHSPALAQTPGKARAPELMKLHRGGGRMDRVGRRPGHWSSHGESVAPGLPPETPLQPGDGNQQQTG